MSREPGWHWKAQDPGTGTRPGRAEGPLAGWHWQVAGAVRLTAGDVFIPAIADSHFPNFRLGARPFGKTITTRQ
jgi:hypothetical protein